MKTTRYLGRLVLTTGMMLTTALSAQGMRQQGQDAQQIWLKFEKELGLQRDFSVDMDIQTMGMTMPSKVYRTGDKTRSEMTLPFMSMKIVALQLTENGKAVNYSLFPDKKKYCVNPETAGGEADAEKMDYTLNDAGTEVYEGVTCKKSRMTVKLPDGGTQVMDMLFSPAQKNMPVKMTSNAKIKTEPDQPPMTITSVILFKNYRFGKPDAALFTIPKDYVKAANMQEVMMGGGALLPSAGGQQGGGMTLPPEALKALQEAQAEAAKEAETEAAPAATGAEAMRQNLQKLRGLLGR